MMCLYVQSKSLSYLLVFTIVFFLLYMNKWTNNSDNYNLTEFTEFVVAKNSFELKMSK